MNNEEKILEMLTKMDHRQIRTEEMLGQMQADMTGMKADMTDMRDRLVKVEVTQENVIIPQIQALAEAISTINDKLITRSEFEAVKEELAFLKDIVRMHTSQINDLRKAQ